MSPKCPPGVLEGGGGGAANTAPVDVRTLSPAAPDEGLGEGMGDGRTGGAPASRAARSAAAAKWDCSPASRNTPPQHAARSTSSARPSVATMR